MTGVCACALGTALVPTFTAATDPQKYKDSDSCAIVSAVLLVLSSYI